MAIFPLSKATSTFLCNDIPLREPFKTSSLTPEEKYEFITSEEFWNQMGSFYGFLGPPTVCGMNGTTPRTAPSSVSRHRTGRVHRTLPGHVLKRPLLTSSRMLP